MIKKIISIVLFLIAVVMIVTGSYILNSSKYIFEIVLSKSLDAAVDSMYTDNFMIDDIDFNKYKITTDNSLNALGMKVFSINGDIYGNKNKLYLNLKSKMAFQDFIKLETIVDNSKMYFKLKDAVDKFYYIEFDNMLEEDYSNIDLLEEVKIITNHLKKSILKDLNNDDFEKNSETLMFDSKAYKTNKISLNLSGVELRQIIINFLENIINDNKAIQVLQKIDNSITVNDVKEYLENFKEKSVNAISDDVLNISFYISGFSDLIRLELLTLNREVDSVASDNLLVTLDKYKNQSNNNVLRCVFKVNNQDLINIKTINETKNKTNLEILVNDGSNSLLIKGDHSKYDAKIEINLSLKYDKEDLGTVSYLMERVNKDKEYNLEIKYNPTNNMMELVSINNIYLNEDMPNVDVSESTNFDDISEEDNEKLMTYIHEKLLLLGFGGLIENPEEEYNFDDIVE